MEINAVMPTSFKGRLTKIMAEIRTRACIDDVDAEAIEKILKDELDFIDEYYEEEYYYAASKVHDSAYDAGYTEGYAAGYSERNS